MNFRITAYPHGWRETKAPPVATVKTRSSEVAHFLRDYFNRDGFDVEYSEEIPEYYSSNNTTFTGVW